MQVHAVLARAPGAQGRGWLRMQGYFKARGCLDEGVNSTDGGVALRRDPLITVITAVLNGGERPWNNLF